MRILIVGGTGFLGGAVARNAVTMGHAVTVMTRSGANVADGAQTLIADREAPLPNLHGQFDTVVDTCGYAPDMVQTLAAAVGDVHYIFVSSISVYPDLSVPQSTEATDASNATQADLKLADGVPAALRGTADPYGAAYGPLKRACELQAQAQFGDRCSLIRLGLIIGPKDYTDRFTWWVRRADAGGDLHIPGPSGRLIQMIDVEDAAKFMLHLADKQTAGTFHATGKPITISQMLSAIADETGVPLRPVYAPLAKFTGAGLRHWTDLPLILPDDPKLAEMLNVSVDKALAAGLTLTPLRASVAAILAWDRSRRDVRLICGMGAADEARVAALL